MEENNHREKMKKLLILLGLLAACDTPKPEIEQPQPKTNEDYYKELNKLRIGIWSLRDEMHSRTITVHRNDEDKAIELFFYDFNDTKGYIYYDNYHRCDSVELTFYDIDKQRLINFKNYADSVFSENK